MSGDRACLDRSCHDCELQMSSELHSCWVGGRRSTEMQQQPYIPELCLNPALETDGAVWICAMVLRNQDSLLPFDAHGLKKCL